MLKTKQNRNLDVLKWLNPLVVSDTDSWIRQLYMLIVNISLSIVFFVVVESVLSERLLRLLR